MNDVTYVTVKGKNLTIGYQKSILNEHLNVDMVDGFHISQNPAPNTIIPFDQNGIFDISATYAKIDSYTLRRVNLTNAVDEYELQVGEEAEIDFENVSELPLHIATTDGTFYEFDLISSNLGGTGGSVSANIYLYPNNTVYSNAFRLAIFYRNSDKLDSFYEARSGFAIGGHYSSISGLILNRTVYKNVRAIVDRYGWSTTYPSIGCYDTDWRDTTTPWTSLGTISFPQPMSGKFLIRRLL